MRGSQTYTHTHTPTHHIWQHTHTLNFLLRTDIVHMSGYTQARWGGGNIRDITLSLGNMGNMPGKWGIKWDHGG